MSWKEIPQLSSIFLSVKHNKPRKTNFNYTQKIHHNQILIQENEGKIIQTVNPTRL